MEAHFQAQMAFVSGKVAGGRTLLKSLSAALIMNDSGCSNEAAEKKKINEQKDW